MFTRFGGNLNKLYSYIIFVVTFFLPDHRGLMALRGFLYRAIVRKSGTNFQVSSGVRILSPSSLIVGDNVLLANNVILGGAGTIEIGNDCLIGFNTVVNAGNHRKGACTGFWGLSSAEGIRIEDGVWIGANCVITDGSLIQHSVVVAAGSCVSGKIGPGGIYGSGIARRVAEKSGFSNSRVDAE